MHLFRNDADKKKDIRDVVEPAEKAIEDYNIQRQNIDRILAEARIAQKIVIKRVRNI